MGKFSAASLSAFGTILALASVCASAEELMDQSHTAAATRQASPVSAGWDVTLAPKYIWQGLDYSNGGSVVQPGAYVAVKDFSVALWANYDVNTSKSDEFDLYLQYDWQLANLSVGTGYAYYDYPQNPPHRDNWDPSQEVYVSVALDTSLSPTLNANYDFDAGKGAYYSLGVSKDLRLPFGSDLSLGSEIYYQRGYYDQTGFPSVAFNISSSLNAGAVTVSPSLAYFYTWENGDFRGGGAVPDTWLFSVNIAHDY